MTTSASRRKPATQAIRAESKKVDEAVAALLQLGAQPVPVLNKALLVVESQSSPRLLGRLAKALESHVASPGLAKPLAIPNARRDEQGTRLRRTFSVVDVRRKLAVTGAIVTASELSKRLGISPQALSKAVRVRRMFTLEVDSARLYPAFFADPLLEREQLEVVARELRELPGWSKWQFFTTPKASLGGRTPLDALKKGKLQEVRQAALGFAER